MGSAPRPGGVGADAAENEAFTRGMVERILRSSRTQEEIGRKLADLATYGDEKVVQAVFLSLIEDRAATPGFPEGALAQLETDMVRSTGLPAGYVLTYGTKVAFGHEQVGNRPPVRTAGGNLDVASAPKPSVRPVPQRPAGRPIPPRPPLPRPAAKRPGAGGNRTGGVSASAPARPAATSAEPITATPVATKIPEDIIAAELEAQRLMNAWRGARAVEAIADLYLSPLEGLRREQVARTLLERIGDDGVAVGRGFIPRALHDEEQRFAEDYLKFETDGDSPGRPGANLMGSLVYGMDRCPECLSDERLQRALDRIKERAGLKAGGVPVGPRGREAY